MEYKKHQNNRNARRKLLINMGINKLPTKIIPILKALEIPTYKYGDNREFIKNHGLISVASKSNGFTVMIDGGYYIFYNEKISIFQIRFTLAHELGHIVCGHLFKTTDNGMYVTQKTIEPSDLNDIMEHEANVFASRLLSPVCVRSELKLLLPQRARNTSVHTN